MASAGEKVSSEICDPLAEFTGRMFMVDGFEFFVGEKVVNKLVELSEFFRAMLTSDFMESKQKAIPIEDVSKEDFDAFLRIICSHGLLSSMKEPYNEEVHKILKNFTDSLAKANIVSVIYLCDRFMALKIIDMVILVLDKSYDFHPRAIEDVDLIQLLEVAFEFNHNALKVFSVDMMRKVSITLERKWDPDATPLLSTSRSVAKYLCMGHVNGNETFFVNNINRINNLNINIKKFICTQYPSVGWFINH